MFLDKLEKLPTRNSGWEFCGKEVLNAAIKVQL